MNNNQKDGIKKEKSNSFVETDEHSNKHSPYRQNSLFDLNCYNEYYNEFSEELSDTFFPYSDYESYYLRKRRTNEESTTNNKKGLKVKN